MGKVNYIVHMNAIFESFNSDVRIKQGHITLYFAFFQKWNREFFKEKLTINSALIMDAAKIRSKSTYHNYLKDLNDWGYLHYFPSYHPSRGSIVKLPKFGTTDGTFTVQKLDNTVPKPSQNLVSSYKHKTKGQPVFLMNLKFYFFLKKTNGMLMKEKNSLHFINLKIGN